MRMEDMEGYDELIAKLLGVVSPEQRVAGLTPEQRLAGLAPEQRLAGLAPEQRLAGLDRNHEVLAFSIGALRALNEEYIRSLSPEVQAEIQRRLKQDKH